MITDLEPDILECEVKWALESITMNKASGSDRIPVQLLQILKDDAVKALHSICQQIWKTQHFHYVSCIGRQVLYNWHHLGSPVSLLLLLLLLSRVSRVQLCATP